MENGYIYFETLGFMGVFSGIINPREIPVRLWCDKVSRTVIGDTATGHILIGQRRWMVSPTKNGIEIKTEARERASDRANWFGMIIAGKKLQREIWCRYFLNIRDGHPGTIVQINDKQPDEGAKIVDPVPPEIEWTPREPYPGYN
jgi:hypothetical protein